jgi:ketosteroid isomerase-like protein
LANAEVVRAFWSAIEARDWERVHEVCDERFVYTLPQSGERFDRERFVRMNREYPGDWHLSIDTLVEGGELVVTEVAVSSDARVDRAVSFFEVRGDKILSLREYWPEPFAIPEWRRGW